MFVSPRLHIVELREPVVDASEGALVNGGALTIFKI